MWWGEIENIFSFFHKYCILHLCIIRTCGTQECTRDVFGWLSISPVTAFETKFHLSHINLCILVFSRNSDCRVCCQPTLLSFLAAPGSPSRPFSAFYLQLVADHPAYRDSRVIKIPTKTRRLSYYFSIRNKKLYA